jgi:hypothetical protein
MCFFDLSSCELIGLASSIAITFGKDLNADQSSTLSAFFSALGDNFAIIANSKSQDEDSSKEFEDIT